MGPQKKSQKNYFNSIKVRLKLGMLYEDMYLTAFQFHKGTIKTLSKFNL